MGRSFGTGEFLFLLKAIRSTLLLSLGALAGGAIVFIAILRIAPSRPLRCLATGYIGLFQGTPVLMQLFVTYYGLAVLFNIQVDAWPAVLLAFSLYSGAFLGEIWRGSIEAIPRAQWEAAACLSLSFPKQLWYVILPQAARISIPPTVGFAVQLIKNTSIAAIIGFVELTRAMQTGSVTSAGWIAGALLYRRFLKGITARALLNLSIALAIVTTAAFLLLWSEVLAAAINFFSGLATMIAFVATLSLAADYCPPRAEGFAFAALMSVTNFTGAVSDNLGSFLYEHLFQRQLDPLILVSASYSAKSPNARASSRVKSERRPSHPSDGSGD
jgi:polar amino acid transport system permease protein